MHVLDINEIFWMTFYTYDRIIEEWWKNWPDAFALYVKLIKQSRIQQTDQTKSLNVFLKNWLKRTDERLKKARDVLKSLWLINDIIVRDELGRIIWHYVRVNYLINENKVRTLGMDYNLSTTPEIQDMDNTTYGKSDTNALSNININALSNIKENNTKNQNQEQSQEQSQDTNVSFPKQKDSNTHTKTSELDFIKNSDDIRDIFDDDEIAQHKIQLKIILKMVELWYKVKKSKSDIEKEFERLKAKAKLYWLIQWDWNIAWTTFYQKIDKRFDWHTEKWKKVKNFKTSIIPFISK